MSGDRVEALKLWQQIATGPLDGEARAWVQHVAAKLLEADVAKPKQRPAEIMKAVGLFGKLETTRALREAIENSLDDFCDLDHETEPQKPTMQDLIKRVRDSGLTLIDSKGEELTDEEIRKRIEYVRGK